MNNTGRDAYAETGGERIDEGKCREDDKEHRNSTGDNGRSTALQVRITTCSEVQATPQMTNSGYPYKTNINDAQERV